MPDYGHATQIELHSLCKQRFEVEKMKTQAHTGQARSWCAKQLKRINTRINQITKEVK